MEYEILTDTIANLPEEPEEAAGDVTEEVTGGEAEETGGAAESEAGTVYNYYCVADEELLAAVEQQTEAIQEQTEVIREQTRAMHEDGLGVCLVLGVIAGMLFMLGFFEGRD